MCQLGEHLMEKIAEYNQAALLVGEESEGDGEGGSDQENTSVAAGGGCLLLHGVYQTDFVRGKETTSFGISIQRHRLSHGKNRGCRIRFVFERERADVGEVILFEECASILVLIQALPPPHNWRL